MVWINNEILLLIAENLSDQQDRLQMLLVCSRWYTILFPIAYRSISIKDEQIYSLARRVAKKPSIGAAIRDLYVCWGRGQAEEYDAQVIKDAVRQICDSPAVHATWDEWIQEKDSDALLALLLLSLKNLTSLEMEFSIFADYPILARVAMRKPPFDEKPALQRLERVEVWTEDNKSSFEVAEFFPLFRLPAIRVFSAHALYEDDDRDSPKPGPGTLAIKELHLGSAWNRCNGSSGMADYITACKNLEVLEYQHRNMAIWGKGEYSFQARKFYTALTTQKHSLRELRLNDQGDYDNADGESDEEHHKNNFNRFGSLVEFHQLRELRIPVRTILEFGYDEDPTVSLLDVLPSSLEYLHLAHCYQEDFEFVLNDLEEIIEQRTERFPNLRKIRVQPEQLDRIPGQRWRFVVPASVQEAFEELMEPCYEAGIDFGLCKAEYLF